MKKMTYTICLVSFMLCWVSCGYFTVKEMTKVSPLTFSIDSTLQIKNLQDIKVIGDLLYLTYDYVGGYGHQILCNYHIDYNNNKLKFNKVYFREDNNYYSVFVPVSFWDNNGNMFVAERDLPNINIVYNDSLYKTSNALISVNAQTPYEMVLEAKQAFYKSPEEYYFIGRQPMSGIQAIFHSDNRNGKLVVTEVKKIIYDERYPSWILNHGTFSYNHSNEKGAYAFQMFPAIHIYDFVNKKDKTIKFNKESFNINAISEADVWEMNPIQFKALGTTKEYIFALYWGTMASEMETRHSNGTAETKIIKYDWNGNIQNTYVINKGLQAFCVSDDNKKIIAYDGKEFLLINL